MINDKSHCFRFKDAQSRDTKVPTDNILLGLLLNKHKRMKKVITRGCSQDNLTRETV